jgi:hypothetical protein
LSNIVSFIIYNKSSDNKLFLLLLTDFEGPKEVGINIDFGQLSTYNIIMFKPLWMKESIIVLKLSSHTIDIG